MNDPGSPTETTARATAASLRVLPPAPTGATGVGGLFVSNYPPFQYWQPRFVDGVRERLAQAPEPGARLGVYVHIPFCRKRCDFCYYKVYAERGSAEVSAYVDALEREIPMWAALPAFAGRRPRFVYFGGGTPSYLSSEQLARVFVAMQQSLPWDEAEEVTFESEPGTINDGKLRILKESGVTRLSLGIESFAAEVLERNGRSHGQRQIYQAYEAARRAGIPQINIDLIAGMIDETDASWDDAVRRAIALQPDSVTIYQMEVPANSLIARGMREEGRAEAPVAGWELKRAWTKRAFEALAAEGYLFSSAYTMVRGRGVTFGYRDNLWSGADMLPLGVSSFGTYAGAHFQDEKEIETYLARVGAGELPLQRGYLASPDERLIRETILQLKLGVLRAAPFRRKFGVDLHARFAAPLDALVAEGLASVASEDGDTVLRLTPDALLRVDTLLPAFYLPEHR